MYSLRTFGALVLSRDGSTVEPLETQRKALAILTVLATDGTVSRDRLMALLWPDSDIDRARGSLKQAIHSLRHQLDASDLVLGKNDLSLNPSLIRSDVARFQAALKAGETREAVALYQGPFLDGVHLNGSAEIEQWVESRRGSLAQEYRNGLERLARDAETRGELAEAVDWWTRRAAEDPLDGKATLHLMQALAAAGQPTAALQHQRAHEDLLRRELDLAPDPAILTLAERLRSLPRTGKPATSRSPIRVTTTPSNTAPSGPDIPDKPARLRPGRIRWLALATVLVGAAGLLGWQLLQDDHQPPTEFPTADPAVAVLPFRAVGPSVEYLGEGMVDLLSFNVEGIEGLRKIDPSTVVTAWRALGGNDSAPLEQENALEVARRVHARYLVTGSAVQLGDQIRLAAEVRDVERGELRGTAQVTGPTDSVSTLVDQLTLELLRLDLLPSDGDHPPISLSAVTTTSLAALKAYLAGEREYRVAHWEEAAQQYLRALELDSTFARALYRLMKANDWGGGTRNPDNALRLTGLIDRLPERDRMLIEGDLGIRVANHREPDSVPGFVLIERLLQRYPDDVEGWVALGERYFHDHGTALLPTSTYRTAFTRAIQLNPYYGEAYVHLIEDAFLQLDSAGAKRLIDEYAAIGGQKNCTFQLGYDLGWGSEAARGRALTALDTLSPMEVWNGCLPIGPMAAPPVVMDRIGKMFREVADTASDPGSIMIAFYLLRVKMLAPMGRITAIQKGLATIESDTWSPGWQIMLHLSEFPDSLAAHDAARKLENIPQPIAAIWRGWLAAAERRWDEVEEVGRTLDRQAQDLTAAGEGALASEATAYAAVLRAYARFVRADRAPLPDVESALGRLPHARIYAPPSSYLRYQVGKLLFEQRRLSDAERYFLSFGPLDFYTSQAELYLGRINEAQGRTGDAVQHYRRFITWWQYADPSLRGPLEEARAAVRRLTRGPDN